MPYQRSTKATGFRKRTGLDESKQLRQYATALDTQRKEDVKGMERQGVQMSNEMTRIDALASKKDTYELNNLRNFSKTLDTFMNTVATNVVKPVFDQQIENGVTKGIAYQQGDPDVVAEIDANDAQLAEIEAKITKQAEKTEDTVDNIRKNWEETGYIPSLKEEYRLLNIKKLGSNRAFGFRKGILMQSATGYDAYRDSALIYNENNPLSTENIGTEEDPIIIGHYHRYKGEAGFEKKKAILGHLTNSYAVEKGKESGLSEHFINKLLTRPILKSNAEFQQKEAKSAILEEAATASENNKHGISLGIEGVDADGGEELVTNIQTYLNTEPGNLRALQTSGSKVMNANDALIEALVGDTSKLRSESMQNIDDQEDVLNVLETGQFYVPGVSKRYKNKDGEWVYEKKTLSELWPSKFNMNDIRAKLAEETDRIAREKQATISSKIKAQRNQILIDYSLNRSIAEYDVAVAAMKSNEEFLGYIEPKFWEDMKAKRDKVPYGEQESQEKFDALFALNDEEAIDITHPTLKLLDSNVIRKALKEGKIAPDIFAGNTEAMSAHLVNSKALLQELKTGLKNNSQDFEWDDNNNQVLNAITLIDSRLRKYTKDHLNANAHDTNYTLKMAVEAANTQLYTEMQADINNELIPGRIEKHWEMNNEGFTHARLKKAYDPSVNTDAGYILGRSDKTIAKAKKLIQTSSHVDVFTDPSHGALVKVEDFTLTKSGAVAPIWFDLAKVDPLKRAPERLYEVQAEKLGLEVPQWNAEQQGRIDKWEALYPNIRAQLSSGNFTAASRAMEEIGKLNLDHAVTTMLTEDGLLNVTEEELPQLLDSLGLDTMTLDELQKQPELFLAAYKKKLLNITEQVQLETTDQNQALRMIFAGVKFNDITKWDDPYTLAALNTYYSGDSTPLDKLNAKFNMNPNEKGQKVDIQSGDPLEVYKDDPDKIWDVASIDTELALLDSDVPPQLLKTGTIPGSLGVLAVTQPNPAYKTWAARKQLLNDRKLFINQSEKGYVDPRDQGALFTAGKRIVGGKRYSEMQEQVLTQFPSLKLHEKGYIYDPSTGYSRVGTEVFKGRDMLQVLLLNEVGVQGDYQGGVVGDTTTPLTIDASEITVGSPSAGKLNEKDLVTIKGYVFGNSSANQQAEDIKIRKDVAPDLENMIDAAAKEGIYLNFTEDDDRWDIGRKGISRIKGAGSGYRSFDESVEAKKRLGDVAAEPGMSTHNLGAAVDFQFSDDDALAAKQVEWLHREGWKYGFVPYSLDGQGEPDYSLRWERGEDGKIKRNESWHFDWRPEYKNRRPN